jgi:seryl-tRNA synthetase
MLDIKFIRENPALVQQNTENKNESGNVESLLDLDTRRRKLIGEVEKLKSIRNTVSKEIAALKKNKQDAEEKIRAMKEVSEQIKDYDEQIRNLDEEIRNELLKIPNMLHESVPIGKSEEDNIEIKRWGEIKTEKTKDHIQLAKGLNIIDFERAAKVSGSGFAYYIGKGAALERALINFMLEHQTTTNGYTEIMPPLIVNPGAMVGTGQLPKMVDDMYFVQRDDFYLIPTAEVPITNFHSGETLKAEMLPIKYCGYTPCFRREAGSYGKETRGFLRVHQFNKVELVKFTKPEDSYNELETLLADAESILQALNIPYRVILLCSGDTSFSSAKTYDIEVWSPGEQKWLEASSVSNFEDFQARRANIRFKRTPKDKPEFVHTLNGSGLATSRLIVALLENYAQPDGSIKVPDVLQKYTGFDVID